MRCFKNVAELIKSKRIHHPRNLSQADLSHLLGYKNGQFISNVERGLCSIPLKMLKKVGEILDISQEELKSAILKDHQITLNNYLVVDGEVRGRRKSDPSDNVVEPNFDSPSSDFRLPHAAGE